MTTTDTITLRMELKKIKLGIDANNDGTGVVELETQPEYLVEDMEEQLILAMGCKKVASVVRSNEWLREAVLEAIGRDALQDYLSAD